MTIRYYLVSAALMLLETAAGYAKYYNWDGEACWANRLYYDVGVRDCL